MNYPAGDNAENGHSTLRPRRWPALLPLLLLFAATALLASCGGEEGSSTATTTQSTTATAGASTPVEEVDLTALPLGDGNISSEPKVDYVYSCQSEFGDNAGGALADGPWLDEEAGTWDASRKIAVPGKNDLDSSIDVEVEGSGRTISGNDQPEDPVGDFPVPEDSEAYQYDPNPNEITEQDFSVTVPAVPEKAGEPACLSLGSIGVMLNGAYFFNALDGPGRDAVAHEIQDGCDGHPERGGAYHYHSLSTCIEGVDEATNEHSGLVGYAIDGFGLYGHHGEDGEVLSNNDLDECHGHTHEVEWDGETTALYHYHATFEYPYTLGCYRGEPAEDSDLGAPAAGGGATQPAAGGPAAP